MRPFLEQLLVGRGDRAFLAALPTGAGTVALLAHFGFEAFAIDVDAALAGDVFLLVEGEAVGVVQLEGHGAGNSAVGELRDFVAEDFFGDEECGGVAMLFVLHDASDALNGFHHLGIAGAHQLGDEAGEFVEIWILLADEAGVAHGAAHDFTEHVAAAFVGGQHAVVDEEGCGAGVVGVDSQRGVGFRRRLRIRLRRARRRDR